MKRKYIQIAPYFDFLRRLPELEEVTAGASGIRAKRAAVMHRNFSDPGFKARHQAGIDRAQAKMQALRQTEVHCPYCNKTSKWSAAFFRWHLEKCKEYK